MKFYDLSAFVGLVFVLKTTTRKYGGSKSLYKIRGKSHYFRGVVVNTRMVINVFHY